ncbi:glycoside hydrolase family 43 protein, partial [uncultured Bacteroides sp.]|uniref:glycoside hydrolase family 43 protein n=1 Tax=uncultured Bacteroides sp. TaxID=162156 RepID=UPI0025945E89
MKKTLSIFVVLFLFTFCGMAQGYRNPIIPGFHPDPSICRAGEDYYIVNSSFEYFPGVPIFHSRDLVNWKQTGHVLTRESQLKIKGGNMWGGIYAPTIRYNDGTYYMITTNTSDRGNFLVYTDNPSGEWSDPVWIKQGGIDPSLYFEDGHCYMVSNPDGAIWLCEINPKTGEMLTESKRLWAGTGGRFPEGPHIYKRDGWYYLMISEGGTEYGHKVTIARSRNIEGPYESNPANPILTHINQNAQNNPIQGVGHADMVQAHDGSWWLVCLGFRTQNGQHHVLGRETFLAPVSWNKEGWPVVNVDGTINIDMKDVKTLPQTTIKNSPDWDFNNSELGVEWNWIGIPVKENYSLKENKGFLRIKGSDKKLDDYGVSPTFVGRRQEDINFQATTRMKAKGNGNVGMTAYLCPSAHYDLYVTDGQLKLRYRLNDLCHVEDICKVTDDFIYLRIKGSDEIYSLMYSTDGTHYSEAGHMNTRYLSTETNGGFTGVYIGLFAEGDVQADYDNFKYMPIVPEVSPKLMSGDANP